MVIPKDGYTKGWLYKRMVIPRYGYTKGWLRQRRKDPNPDKLTLSGLGQGAWLLIIVQCNNVPSPNGGCHKGCHINSLKNNMSICIIGSIATPIFLLWSLCVCPKCVFKSRLDFALNSQKSHSKLLFTIFCNWGVSNVSLTTAFATPSSLAANWTFKFCTLFCNLVSFLSYPAAPWDVL